MYERCCSIGPCFVSVDAIDPDLTMAMTIERDSSVVYEGSTTTDEMVRTYKELVSYYTRHNTVPEISVLLTGTSLVPDEDFALAVRDEVRIDIEGVGELANPVVEV